MSAASDIAESARLFALYKAALVVKTDALKQYSDASAAYNNYLPTWRQAFNAASGTALIANALITADEFAGVPPRPATLLAIKAANDAKAAFDLVNPVMKRYADVLDVTKAAYGVAASAAEAAKRAYEDSLKNINPQDNTDVASLEALYTISPTPPDYQPEPPITDA